MLLPGIALSLLVLFLLYTPEPAVRAAPLLVEKEVPALQTDGSDAPMDVSARAYAIIDVASGEILASSSGDEPLPLASVTKLFTADAVLENTLLWSTTTITASDVSEEGRAGKLSIGDTYTLHELLFPLLLESSNDAAATLERTIPGLLDRMSSDEATFMDASGIASANRMSAHALARVARERYRDVPHLFDITTLKSYIGEHTGWINNNPFVNDVSYRGGKHGFTEVADHTAVAFFDEESVGVVGYVLLGSTDLVADMATVREYVSLHARRE